jgi:Ca2+-binding EF-hand superfamily protein
MAPKAVYSVFPDESTSRGLEDMRRYFADMGTTPLQVFKDLDEAETGRLSYWEFYKGFKKKGFKLEQQIAEKLMKLLDETGSGGVELRAFEKVFDHLVYKKKKQEQLEAKANPSSITWDKLCDVLAHKRGTITDQIMRLDTDRSGKLSYWEFSQGLKKLGLRFDKRQTEQLLHDMDRDGDGEVSIGEFVGAVMGHVGKRKTEAAKAVKKAEVAEQRKKVREQERIEFEQQQFDAIKASHLSSYEVRGAWNKVNRAIRKKGRAQMTKLFYEFDEDGSG